MHVQIRKIFQDYKLEKGKGEKLETEMNNIVLSYLKFDTRQF